MPWYVIAGGVAMAVTFAAGLVLAPDEVPTQFYEVAAQVNPVFLVALAIEQNLLRGLGTEAQYVRDQIDVWSANRRQELLGRLGEEIGWNWRRVPDIVLTDVRVMNDPLHGIPPQPSESTVIREAAAGPVLWKSRTLLCALVLALALREKRETDELRQRGDDFRVDTERFVNLIAAQGADLDVPPSFEGYAHAIVDRHVSDHAGGEMVTMRHSYRDKRRVRAVSLLALIVILFLGELFALVGVAGEGTNAAPLFAVVLALLVGAFLTVTLGALEELRPETADA